MGMQQILPVGTEVHAMIDGHMLWATVSDVPSWELPKFNAATHLAVRTSTDMLFIVAHHNVIA